MNPSSSSNKKSRRREDEKPFLIDLDLAALDHARFGFLFDAIKIEQIQVQIAGHGAYIFATGQRCHFLEPRFVQFGEDQLALCYLSQIPPVPREAGIGPPAGIPHTEDKDLDPLSGSIPGRFKAALLHCLPHR